MQDWVRTSDLHGDFLVPLEAQITSSSTRSARSGSGQAGRRSDVGALFYAQWRPREEAVRKLHTAQEFLAYARANRIPFVVLGSNEGSCAGEARLVKKTGAVTLCEVGM